MYAGPAILRTHDFGSMFTLLGSLGCQVFRFQEPDIVLCLRFLLMGFTNFLDIFDRFIKILSFLTVDKWPYRIVDTASGFFVIVFIN